MVNNDITLMGRVLYRNRRDLFGIKVKDRLRHMFILGQTGTGKSTLLFTMAKDDMEKGRGIAVIDPHGDLVQRLLLNVPKHRRNDLVYFDATNIKTPFPFNPLAEKYGETPGQKSRLVSAIFKRPGRISGGQEASTCLGWVYSPLPSFPG